MRKFHGLSLRLLKSGGTIHFTNQLQKEENIAQAAYTGQQLAKAYPCAKADTQRLLVTDFATVQSEKMAALHQSMSDQRESCSTLLMLFAQGENISNHVNIAGSPDIVIIRAVGN